MDAKTRKIDVISALITRYATELAEQVEESLEVIFDQMRDDPKTVAKYITQTTGLYVDSYDVDRWSAMHYDLRY